ncbi:MAG TPA: glycosyltransferase family 4 protein [Terriglobales bacterium]|jgi:glycosyltransferase involved in cell wall biosynthesis|nr:glycosyltransferase family 4 protein [Terriglobales bacterium]
MRILWVKADKLLPVQNGGNIRTYHVLRYLSARHELTFYSYYAGKPDPDYERELQRLLPGAIAVCTGKKELAGMARGMDYVGHLSAQPPYAVSRFADDAVQRRIRTWFCEERFDVAVCDFLDAAVNFPGRLNIPSVLFQHNVESEIWRRHAETAVNPAKKVLYRMEFRKMLRYEQSRVRKFQHVIAVSDNDRSLMMKWVDADRITVVPTGVDLAQYAPGPEASKADAQLAPLITFIGAMDWEPNVDGVEYFCSEIWPGIKAEVPEARFRIVGRNPVRRVEKWVSESIEVTGRVPSVIEHLRESAVVIVPLRIGGGTRLKIYEAMAAGKAVVSTTVGAEGLDVHHGRDIILADDARAFSQAVIMLLRDRDLRGRYEKAAAETTARYDWAAIGQRFSEVLQLVAEKKSRKAGAIPARLA